MQIIRLISEYTASKGKMTYEQLGENARKWHSPVGGDSPTLPIERNQEELN
jgi:hypothetical protein